MGDGLNGNSFGDLQFAGGANSYGCCGKGRAGFIGARGLPCWADPGMWMLELAPDWRGSWAGPLRGDRERVEGCRDALVGPTPLTAICQDKKESRRRWN